MRPRSQKQIRHRRSQLHPHWRSATCFALILLTSCHRTAQTTIAVIPRTTAVEQWELLHLGTKAVAFRFGVHVYWNAPTREDDIAAQIAMVERVTAGHYQGLILAPDQAQALITPVRRAMSRGLPVVVVGSPLSIPPGNGLCYILNDEEAGGRIAAQRVAAILHGHGTVAVVGIDSKILGIMTRAHSLEKFLTENYPEIHIVMNQSGGSNVPNEQLRAEVSVRGNRGLDAIVALTSASAYAALWAIGSSPGSHARVIVFDPDTLTRAFDDPNVDSLVVEDMQNIGAEAVLQILRQTQGRPMAPVIQFEPVLLTRENIDSEERNLYSLINTWPVESRSKWMIGP
jgi:ribose transport system substrate-binding protein